MILFVAIFDLARPARSQPIKLNRFLLDALAPQEAHLSFDPREGARFNANNKVPLELKYRGCVRERT